MDIEQKNDANSSSPKISDNDALEIMSLLMKRGYFQENVTPIRSEAIQFISSRNKQNSNMYPKDGALLIETSNKSYIMVDVLRDKFMEELQARGRLMIADAAISFFVSSEVLLYRVIPLIMDQNHQSDTYITVTTASGHIKEILLNTYFQKQTQQLFCSLREDSENGWMSVSDAAKTVYQLPNDVTLTQLEKFIIGNKDNSDDVRILLMDNASKALVTAPYLESIKSKLIQTLGDNCDAPIDIRILTKSNAWEHNWVKQIIQEGLHVPGEFHGDMYIPSRYVEEKRNLVTTSYATNGFITSHMCYKMFDISPSQMKEYVTRNIPEESYIVLPNSVVNKDTIITPLLELALDASESKHWLDLQLHIPIELLEYETNDVQGLIDTYILSVVSGVACVRSHGALFFSEAMVQHFTKKRLLTIVKSFGIARAKELFASHKQSDFHSQSDQFEACDVTISGKEKRSNRRSAKSSSDEGIEIMLEEKGTFPIEKLVHALTEDYPDLLELELPSDLLIEIVKLAFYTEAIEVTWFGAIHTELERLNNDIKALHSGSAKGSGINLDGFQTIQSAFEDPACFATCCYMLQAKAKFVSYAMDCTEQLTEGAKQEIQRDFFAGCCRDFAYRVTQYAFYRNNVGDGIISLSNDEPNDREIFYSPIDVCSNIYVTAHLLITSNQGDLYKVLKEELPSSIGLSLAQTWDFCDNGTKSTSNSVSEASVNDFLDHLRDNCLTYCGLPFAVYDKKAEKKFLATRRSQLMDRLEKATIMSDALDIAIMLLYQTLKNLVVSGPLLQGPIVQMLLAERKLSENVVGELRALISTADQESIVDSSMIERLKELITTKNKK